MFFLKIAAEYTNVKLKFSGEVGWYINNMTNLFQLSWLKQEEIEDTKKVIRIRKSTDIQYNDQTKPG